MPEWRQQGVLGVAKACLPGNPLFGVALLGGVGCGGGGGHGGGVLAWVGGGRRGAGEGRAGGRGGVVGGRVGRGGRLNDYESTRIIASRS